MWQSLIYHEIPFLLQRATVKVWLFRFGCFSDILLKKSPKSDLSLKTLVFVSNDNKTVFKWKLEF